MNKISKLALICFILMNLSSCSKEESNEIEAELQVYFDSFKAEASAHGIEVSFDELDLGGYIENIETRGTLGQCKSYSNGSKKVVVDEPSWNTSSEAEREYLVFHELGHCVLGRSHIDTKDENGICLSIMQSGEGECEGKYDISNRVTLLAELFEN